MKHGYSGKKLSRTKNERRRLFMVLLRSLIEHGAIRTTYAKAKAVQATMDKLITKVKSGKQSGLNEVRKVLADETTVKTLRDRVKTQFAKRTSGYTRITKLGKRRGDAAEEVLFAFVDQEPKTETSAPVKKRVSAEKPAAENKPNVEEADIVSEQAPKKSAKKAEKKTEKK